MSDQLQPADGADAAPQQQQQQQAALNGSEELAPAQDGTHNNGHVPSTVFAQVIYFINDDFTPQDRAEIKQILDAGGATSSQDVGSAGSGPSTSDALPPGARFDPSRTTHVISSSLDFREYDACDDPQADDLQAPTGKRACVVSSQWVRRSWSLGALQPERYFSADPSLIFSGIVISCARLPKRDCELIAAAVISCGGAYREKLTREVTHLVANNRQGPKFAKLNAVFDAQEQQLTELATSLSTGVTIEAVPSEGQENQVASSSKASGPVPANALSQATYLAKSHWNVKVVLPQWIDDCYRLFKLVDPKPYAWPLGEKAQLDGEEPIYLTNRSIQAPFGTAVLKNAAHSILPGASVGVGALHNYPAALRAFGIIENAMSTSSNADPDSAEGPSLSANAVAAQVTGGERSASASSPIKTVAEAILQLALHAPENRGRPTFEEIAPSVKDSERLDVPVDAHGKEIQPGSTANGGRRARGSAAAAAAASASGKSTLHAHGDVLSGRAVLFGADVMKANPDRVYAFRTRIQAAGGKFVEPPEKEEEVPAKVAQADVVVTKFRESKECLQALKQQKTCGSPQWLAFVLATARFPDPRHNLLHFPYPKDPIPAFTKFTITLTNYSGEARSLLRHLITCMGGKFTPEMTSANTHCIAASEEGEKVKRAKEWGIPVLNHIWLEACFTRWQAIDVLQPRFIEYGPAIRYGKQVLVDARLEDGVLEPWLQRALEDEDTAKARLEVEAEILKKRQAAEDAARAAYNGVPEKAKDGNANGADAEAVEEEAEGPGKGRPRPAPRPLSKSGKAKAATKRYEDADTDTVDETTEVNGNGDDDTMLSTRTSRDRRPTKKAAENQDEPKAGSSPTKRTDVGSDGDEMEIDEAVGGGTSTRSGRVLSAMSPPSKSGSGTAASTPTKGKGASVKRTSGAGPASKVPERKGLAEASRTTSTTSGGAAKRRRDEIDEESEDSEDDANGAGQVRHSQRPKTSPIAQRPKTITAVPKGPRLSASSASLKDSHLSAKRKSVGSSQIYYATTGVTVSDADAKILRGLGAHRTEDMFKATHLVAAGLSRTEKMLCAIARGDVMIVDQAWLHMSAKKKTLLEEANYPIQDPKSERKYGFKLEAALEKSRNKPGKLLRKHEFFMTRSIKPAAEVLRKVIIAAGGSAPNALPNLEKLEADKTHVHLISCIEDRALWKDFEQERDPVRVYEAELIISGVLKQHVDWDEHRLV
ncbi:regulator of Ty1 Transposition [Tilletia horrida]|nr:regulator of Ty1 Transposition [Tilletia horrida]